jgi:hypothetical protein
MNEESETITELKIFLIYQGLKTELYECVTKLKYKLMLRFGIVDFLYTCWFEAF